MELISLTCNHCGASLEIPEETRFLTCQFCQTKLAVEHSGNAIFTSVLEELDQKTDQIIEELESLKRENAIARLDRNWEKCKQKYMVSDSDGNKSLPTKTGSVFGGIFIMIVGIIWTVFAATITSDSPFSFGAFFPLFGVFFIVIGLVATFIAYSKATDYEKAHRSYKKRRSSLFSSENTQFDDDFFQNL